MVARGAEVEGYERSRALSARSRDCADAAAEGCHFLFEHLDRRVAQARVEVPRRFEVEEVGELLRGFVFVRRALDNGRDARLAVFRLPAALYGYCFYVVVFVHVG